MNNSDDLNSGHSYGKEEDKPNVKERHLQWSENGLSLGMSCSPALLRSPGDALELV